MPRIAFAPCPLSCPRFARSRTAEAFGNGAGFAARARGPDAAEAFRCVDVSAGARPLPESAAPLIGTPCRGSAKATGGPPFARRTGAVRSGVRTAGRVPGSIMRMALRRVRGGRGGPEIARRDSPGARTARDPAACAFGPARTGRKLQGA